MNVTTQITYTPSSPSDKLYFNVVNSLDFLSFYDLNITVCMYSSLSLRFFFVFFILFCFIYSSFNLTLLSANCNLDCSGEGVCFNGSCRCYKFFTGQHCEIGIKPPSLSFILTPTLLFFSFFLYNCLFLFIFIFSFVCE